VKTVVGSRQCVNLPGSMNKWWGILLPHYWSLNIIAAITIAAITDIVIVIGQWTHTQ